ncbi:MAG TPA: hypothetical protein VIN60_06440 [Anaerolineales bacterium]
MNLTCSYCQTPFTLGMAEKVAALQRMQTENLHHYDAHCPRCGRANSVSFDRIKMFTPGWQDAIKQTASESAPAASAEPEARQLSMPEPASAKAPAKQPIKAAPQKPAKKVVKAEPKKTAKKPAAKKTKKK